MHYLDTSFVVAAFTPEVRTDDAQVWLETQPADLLCISKWVITEIASALAMKVRMGTLSLEDRVGVMKEWNSFSGANVAIFEIAQEDFHTAASFAERHPLNLRAGDALHLAIARRTGSTLMTLDRRMADAAREVGVIVGAIAI